MEATTEMNDSTNEKVLNCIGKNKIAWMICIASFVLNVVRCVPGYCFGIFIAEFKQIYDLPMAELDWIGILSIFFTDLFAPIPTVIIQKVGAKGYAICPLLGSVVLALSCISSSFLNNISWLILTFSLLNGFGSAFIFIPSTLIVNEFFPSEHKYHVLATSTIQCCYVTAMLVFSPLYAWILKISSWRVGFIVQGIKIFVVGTIISCLFSLNKYANGSEKEIRKFSLPDLDLKLDGAEHTAKSDDSKWSDVVRKPARICWLIGVVLTYATTLVAFLNLPHYMEFRGYNKMESSLAVTALGLSQIIASLITVPFGYKFKGKLALCNCVSCVGLSLVMFIWSITNPSYIVIIILTSVIGATSIFSIIFLFAASKEVMEMKMDVAWTATCMSTGVGSLLSPLISGLIFDIRNSYEDVFRVVSLVCLVNCFFYLSVAFIKSCGRTEEVYQQLE